MATVALTFGEEPQKYAYRSIARRLLFNSVLHSFLFELPLHFVWTHYSTIYDIYKPNEILLASLAYGVIQFAH